MPIARVWKVMNSNSASGKNSLKKGKALLQVVGIGIQIKSKNS
jgi:hypothetical protein